MQILVYMRCAVVVNKMLLKEKLLKSEISKHFSFLSQTASQNRIRTVHKKQSTKDRNFVPCSAGS